jgi:hypothetical protein
MNIEIGAEAALFPEKEYIWKECHYSGSPYNCNYSASPYK